MKYNEIITKTKYDLHQEYLKATTTTTATTVKSIEISFDN